MAKSMLQVLNINRNFNDKKKMKQINGKDGIFG